MVDMHIHTLYSDGDKTVAEVLKMCEEKNLEYISITDHNTCEAYFDDAFKNNNIFTGTIIKGCELNAEFKKRAIEILAYNVNPNIINTWGKKYYSEEKRYNDRERRKNVFLNILDKKGIIYNIENIPSQKTLGNRGKGIEFIIWEEVASHPENKDILGEEYFNLWDFFYRKELTNPSSEYFLDKASGFPKAKEIVELIHQAGGKAFLAHPFEYQFKDTIGFIDDLLQEVQLDGIECFHPSAESGERSKILVDYARKNDLYISGGSDYHGTPKPTIQVGVGKGSLDISKDYIDEWL